MWSKSKPTAIHSLLRDQAVPSSILRTDRENNSLIERTLGKMPPVLKVAATLGVLSAALLISPERNEAALVFPNNPLQSLIPQNQSTNLSFSVPSINFGSVDLGGLSTASVNVTNNGPVPLAMGGNLGGSYFQFPFTNMTPTDPSSFDFQIQPVVIPPGQVGQLNVNYLPITPTNVYAVFMPNQDSGPALLIYGSGINTAALVSGTNTSSYIVEYSQSSVQASYKQQSFSSSMNNALTNIISSLSINPSIAFSPTGLQFGNVVVGNGSVQAIKVVNNGTQDEIVSTLLFSQSSGGTNAAFTISSGITQGTDIAAKSSKIIRITYAPPAFGTALAYFTLNFIDGTTASAPLYGNGVGNHPTGLVWDPSPDAAASTVIYRSSQAGGPYTMMGSVQSGITNYTDNTTYAGQTYYYAAKAEDGGAMSGFSNEAHVTVPTP